MSKTKQTYYWQLVEGKVRKLHAFGLVKFLIRNANECLHQNLVELNLPKDFEEQSRLISYKLLSNYLKEGNSKEFIDHINEETGNLMFRHIFTHSKKSNDLVRAELLIMEGNATAVEQVYYPFMCALNSGEIKKVKQCSNKKCNLFFIGRKNQKWCTDRCGSKFRMIEKRKRDFKKKIQD